MCVVCGGRGREEGGAVAILANAAAFWHDGF